jgi:hypothetical protein
MRHGVTDPKEIFDSYYLSFRFIMRFITTAKTEQHYSAFNNIQPKNKKYKDSGGTKAF